jgi:hypothetical protein
VSVDRKTVFGHGLKEEEMESIREEIADRDKSELIELVVSHANNIAVTNNAFNTLVQENLKEVAGLRKLMDNCRYHLNAASKMNNVFEKQKEMLKGRKYLT